MKYLKKNAILKFISVLFFIGFVSGLLLELAIHPDFSSYMGQFYTAVSSTRMNTFLLHGGLISAIFVLSVVIIGAPLIIFYIFYEGLATGYTLGAFITCYGLKGMAFYLFFFLIVKFVFLIVAFYFITISLRFTKKVMQALIQKNRENLSQILMKHFIRYAIVTIGVALNSLFIYFFGNKIISLFQFLIN